MNLRRRLAIEWLLIAIAVTALVLVAQMRQSTSGFDNLLYDQLQARAPQTADPDILLITIDEPSLQKYGRWPWPRDLHAQLIEKLQAAKVRSITFDILLSEASEPAADAKLASAMAGSSPVFIPLHFSAPGRNGRAYDTILPAEQFIRSSRAVGHVNVEFDSDGMVRRAPLCFQSDAKGPMWPHLIETVFRESFGNGRPSATAASTNCGEKLMIPYSKRGSFSEIAYADFMDGGMPQKLLEGRDIFIGATAAGLGDNFPTPNGEGGLLPGVEIMANMLGALKTSSFIEPLSFWKVAALSLVPLWLLLFGFLRLSPQMILATSLSLAVLMLIASIALLRYRFWFPPGTGLVGLLIVYPIWGWRRLQAMSDFMTEELGTLRQSGEISAVPLLEPRGDDVVGRQSAALSEAIGHIRDLRRFIADAMSDLPDPMAVTDLDGNVLMESDIAQVRLGISALGRPLDKLLERAVLPEYREAMLDYMKNHDPARFEPGPRAEPASYKFVRFATIDGGTFAMRKTAVQSADGKLQGYIYYLADITALARAQSEREQVLQLLSHDMRAPQSAIIATLGSKIDQSARARIERNARRTMQLAQDFVDMARMEESAFVGEDILLFDLLRDCADNLWPLAQEKHVTVDVSDDGSAAFVRSEPDSLARAFANLLDNAIKFSAEMGRVEVKIVSRDSKVTVTISDQGPGIDEEILPRLFQRFASTGDKHGRTKGMGLGLNFVEAVIARHGGNVIAQNLDEGGSCFSITLPMSEEADQ